MTSFWRQKPVSYFPAKPLTGRTRISRPFCTVINSNISRHLAGRGRETPTFWRETSFWRQNSRHHLSTSSPLDPIFNGESISGLKMPVSRRPCKLGTTDKNTRLKCPQMGLPMTYGSFGGVKNNKPVAEMLNFHRNFLESWCPERALRGIDESALVSVHDATSAHIFFPQRSKS